VVPFTIFEIASCRGAVSLQFEHDHEFGAGLGLSVYAFFIMGFHFPSYSISFSVVITHNSSRLEPYLRVLIFTIASDLSPKLYSTLLGL